MSTDSGSSTATQPRSESRSAVDTGARTPDAAETVSASRAEIDALDARIISLVEERMTVSARIQRARLSSGGRRVNLAREMEILGRYRDRLGRPGTTLAMTLLELCRGRA